MHHQRYGLQNARSGGRYPLIGSGLYVDPEVGAVTATGHGEEIVRAGGSLLVIEGMRQGLSRRSLPQGGSARLDAIEVSRQRPFQIPGLLPGIGQARPIRGLFHATWFHLCRPRHVAGQSSPHSSLCLVQALIQSA